MIKDSKAIGYLYEKTKIKHPPYAVQKNKCQMRYKSKCEKQNSKIFIGETYNAYFHDIAIGKNSLNKT